ncbi:MAG: four helix bundle protein [Vicinamibacterales bacterium]
MNPKQLQDRTRQFAVDAIRLCRGLPGTLDARHIGHQLLRSATSVAANYRAACRARSRAEFVAKIGIVIEESDEALFWLEMLSLAGLAPPPSLEPLRQEANELTAIFVASRRTAMSRR